MVDNESASIHNLKNIRIKLGLTKAGFARLANVSVATISNIEDKNHTPRETTMHRIVIALNGHSGHDYEIEQIFLV